MTKALDTPHPTLGRIDFVDALKRVIEAGREGRANALKEAAKRAKSMLKQGATAQQIVDMLQASAKAGTVQEEE